ncbi:uncharacterized protein LOC124699560 [Lolium rigidum]|uniref:uncharacterized protein LOC124699560 n=1 Tax=Lolium rigidum TaxID=89674 RepID=UPI001F5DB677|nr:uncharacterized protein LOC124699560 [Lolium rigidum]
MWSSDSDRDDSASTTTTAASSVSPSSSLLQPQTPPPPRRRRSRNLRRRSRRSKNGPEGEDSEAEAPADAEGAWCGAQWEAAWPRRAARPVVLAGEDASPDGAAAGAGDLGVGRARSLTDDDLEELKGCVDLGFGFSYNEIPELCGTLPALELCYSMSQRFLDEHQSPSKADQVAVEPPAAVPASPVQSIPNWKISCPGDSPDEVKARLKYWAQAVACTVKLCS